MWDTVESHTGPGAGHLSHDLPCPWCGHPGHLYLPCDEACDCRAVVMPGGREPAPAA